MTSTLTGVNGNSLAAHPPEHSRSVQNGPVSPTSPADSITQVVPPQKTDAVIFSSLWDRLSHGYRLGNLEELPGRVEKFEQQFAKDPVFFKHLSEQARWFLYYVLEEVEKRDMPAEIALIPAIESIYQPDAVSKAKATGMWQFMETTGKRFGLRQDWWMDARNDLTQSTRAALDYLTFLAKEFNGDWELTLAAYNAGEGAVMRQMHLNRKRHLPTSYAHLKLKRETRSYVPKLMALRNILRNPKPYGITLAPLENHPFLKVIDLKFQTDLSVAARYTSLTYRELKYLNLGYRRGVTPPNGPHRLVVPASDVDHLLAKLDELSPVQRILWAHHKVQPGEYLGKVAQLHGVTAQSIRQANAVSSDLIYPDQELRIPLTPSAYQYAGPTWSINTEKKPVHLVQKGDSLWKISQTYGIRLSDLMLWNQLSETSLLHPGQSITLHP